MPDAPPVRLEIERMTAVSGPQRRVLNAVGVDLQSPIVAVKPPKRRKSKGANQ